jgi:cell division protein FtsL
MWGETSGKTAGAQGSSTGGGRGKPEPPVPLREISRDRETAGFQAHGMKKRFIRWILALLVIALPLLVFANVWYAFKYYELERSIAETEDRQLELIERNKRLITGISILRSPGRIIDEARELGMEMTGQDRIDVIKDDS